MSTGILPFDELKHLINLNTGFFECSAIAEDDQMKVTAGNFDGAGMSGGNLQYNFGAANHLTELFQYMINNHESICINAFGTNTTEYNTWKTAMMGTQTDRVNFGDSISTPKVDPNKNKFIIEPYKTCLGNLLLTPECKAEYYAIRDLYYWDLPFDLFKQLSCISRMALASLFDLYINKGRYYPINLITADFETIDADTTLSDAEKEAKKIYQLNQRGNEEENALNDTSSANFDDRRNPMRDQGGTYYGLAYNPEAQFDMNQEPAISEKSATLNVKFGAIDAKNVISGTNQIKKLYKGATLVGNSQITPYTTTKAPQTQFRTNPGSYAGIGSVTGINLTAGQPLWVDVQNFVACKTYYTIDGSTPTTASPLYTAALTFQASCTLKTLTRSVSGISEAVKTLAITVAGWRYLKITMYGDNIGNLFRVVEWEAWNQAATANLLATKLPIATTNASFAQTNTTAVCTNGDKNTANRFAFMDNATTTPATCTYDLGAIAALSNFNMWNYSATGDQRIMKFKIEVSKDNAAWTEVANYSTNTTIANNVDGKFPNAIVFPTG